METKICQNCKSEFIIEKEDFNFYEKVKVPPPTFCPECRMIRRLLFRNERTLFKRKCDLCNEEKILIYHKDSPYKVYCYSCFWSDKWSAEEYKKDFDFQKSFFDQYLELFKSVPKIGIIQQGLNVNSQYTNRASDNKNCYLLFATADSENCLYGASFWESKDTMDCFNIRKCELCYECIDCSNCNNLKFSKECSSCIDSFFLINCRNCQNCFGCFNLRNKNYCIFNEQFSREEYFKKINEINIYSRKNLNIIKKRIEDIFSKIVTLFMEKSHSVNVSGSWIENSKNLYNSFNCDNVENGRYVFGITNAKDVMDYTYWGHSSELMYEVANIGRQCSSVLFSNECWDQLIRAEYCINCFSSSDLFGCVGLRKKQYCIFNKQYSKEEYFEMVEKIKKHMDEMPYFDTKGNIYKYGEFFPSELSPFAYNETIAQEYFPKNKEEIINKGYTWKDSEDKKYTPTLFTENLSDLISEVGDDILDEIIACVHKGECDQQCTTAFKITKNELQLYRKHNLPIPILCPNCRHYERLKMRNPIKLWHRKCMKEGCENEFETSYAPERPEIVYCEKCYQKEVY